ncbi:MAG: hypothetical protein IKK45_00185 [Akkermansia sp.]|nr:hypothetical protein [Akkermansia sp.]
MGFGSSSSYQPPPATIPVVTQTNEENMRQNYQQHSARKRGLLSTILTSHRKEPQVAATHRTAAADSGNTTLG